MKSIYWQYVHFLMAAFLVSILGSLVPTSAQSCLPDGVIFSSQAQIDAFPTDYPGCIEISGGIIIEETISGDIINLNGFSEVTTFESFLEINFNSALKTLEVSDLILSNFELTIMCEGILLPFHYNISNHQFQIY